MTGGTKEIKTKKLSTASIWEIEHYREIEYTFDKNGRLISKKPTSKEEYLRYWRANSGS